MCKILSNSKRGQTSMLISYTMKEALSSPFPSSVVVQKKIKPFSTSIEARYELEIPKKVTSMQ